MKKFFTLCALVATFLSQELKAQFSENFETDSTALKGNCWQFNLIEWTSNPAYVITGAGSMLSHPPVNSSSTRDILTPPLTITSNSLTISFNYKLTNSLNGGSTRTIEIGIMDPSNIYTPLDTVTLNNSSPTTVQVYNNTFPAVPGMKKIVIKTGGSNGGGNVRTVIDDFYTDATSIYAPGTYCNSAPIAVNDLYTGLKGSVIYGNVMTNDNEPDNEIMTAAVVVSSPDGTVVLNPDGTFSFTPSISFMGTTTTFTYQLTDNGYNPLNSNVATVTINYFSGGALPVKLNNFMGSKNKSNVQLRWNVGINEIANTFGIERSTDGKNFETAALLFGTEKAGNESYNYSEVNEDAKVYYRLRMTDKSEVVSYSKILVFSSSASNNKHLNVIGNIVNDKLTFSYQSAATVKAEIRILDMNGKMISRQTLNANKGNNMASISILSSLNNGIYLAVLTVENENSSAKFIKQ
jgi:Bacterial Ig domain/Secretion system C-terminal sorting domain